MSDSAKTRSAAARRPRPVGHPEPLPLYPSEERIVIEVFGEPTAEFMRTWREALPILERNGLPKRDPLMGSRRYWPAVLRWFDEHNGLGAERAHDTPDGKENWR